jgi:hypothetical protein
MIQPSIHKRDIESNRMCGALFDMRDLAQMLAHVRSPPSQRPRTHIITFGPTAPWPVELAAPRGLRKIDYIPRQAPIAPQPVCSDVA